MPLEGFVSTEVDTYQSRSWRWRDSCRPRSTPTRADHGAGGIRADLGRHPPERVMASVGFVSTWVDTHQSGGRHQFARRPMLPSMMRRLPLSLPPTSRV